MASGDIAPSGAPTRKNNEDQKDQEMTDAGNNNAGGDSVETGGLKSAPCTKARVSEMVLDGRTMLAVQMLFLLVVLNSWTMAAVGRLGSVHHIRVAES